MSQRSSENVVILGGPGDGLVVGQAIRDLARAGRAIAIAGFLNDGIEKGETIFGYTCLGPLASWSTLGTAVTFIPALHKVGEMFKRARLILSLAIPEARWSTVVHPTACIADDVQIGAGSFVGPHVTVQPGARLGRFVSVRAGANIGHDAVVEDFAYVGPNATLSGRSRLAQGAHLGPNAAVLDRITIGRYAVVGIGSAVMKNVEEFVVCLGNPARHLRSLRDRETGDE